MESAYKGPTDRCLTLFLEMCHSLLKSSCREVFIARTSVRVLLTNFGRQRTLLAGDAPRRGDGACRVRSAMHCAGGHAVRFRDRCRMRIVRWGGQQCQRQPLKRYKCHDVGCIDWSCGGGWIGCVATLPQPNTRWQSCVAKWLQLAGATVQGHRNATNSICGQRWRKRRCRWV